MPNPDLTGSAVAAENLRFSYGEHRALSLSEFSLDREQSCAVIGPSGCGKSTFVHLLAGLLTPDAGKLQILGEDLSAFSEGERDRFRGRHIGFVFQRFHLFAALSVRENLALTLRLARRGDSPEQIDEILEQLGLGALGDRKPGTLSHGQAQRVAIARALVHKPELVIADEPTSALDDGHAHDALKLLTSVAGASGAALLVVTHDQRVRGQLEQEFDLGVAS